MAGKGIVARVVRRYCHDSPGAVARQHVVGHPHGNLFPRERIYGIRAGKHARHLAVGLAPEFVAFPLVEINGAGGITQPAIFGIGHEPGLVAFKKLLERLSFQCRCAFLEIELVQIFRLGVVDALIVDLRQVVEFQSQALVVFAVFLVVELWQGAQIGILGMKGEDADAAVGIGVGPGVRGGGVVDG